MFSGGKQPVVKEEEKKEEMNTENISGKLFVKKMAINELKGHEAALLELEKAAGGAKRKKLRIEKKPIVYIESEKQHSFTFPIAESKRDVPLKNLVLLSDEEHNYQTYLVQYDCTGSDLVKLNNSSGLNERLTVQEWDNTVKLLPSGSDSGHYLIRIPTLLSGYWNNYGSWIRGCAGLKTADSDSREQMVGSVKNDSQPEKRKMPATVSPGNPEDDLKQIEILTTPVV